ncbi:probable small intestine urate exporter isoform X2 [Dromiciops gliroides]|uniref:probable small intestine urate exporter isoform X2 n=1 Tax=Dromiciops gliroides TaxID=33562 RepID=UPI001CC3D63D|nr:probable small intestine urate exporter isoform X2 [Dromiciops gliroides]
MDPLETANTLMRESTNPQEGEGSKEQHPKVKRFCSVRYAMAIMIHLCNLVVSAQNFSLSIAIIAMVKHPGQSNQSNVSTEGYPGATTDTGVPVYEWSSEIQGFLLSAMIGGTLITTMPSGYFAGVLGGKKLSGLSLLICSVLSILIPLAADYGLSYLFLIRIVQGMAQGIIFGALPSFWPKWAPPLERTQLSTIGFSGLTMGNFIIILVGGFLCESPGWPSMFYISGGIGCIYCIIWFSLVYDDPMNHPFINESEKEYIISSVTGQVPDKVKQLTSSHTASKGLSCLEPKSPDNSSSWSLPFKAMIKTLAFWAIIVPSFCRFWLISNFTISLPSLLDNMFELNIKRTGFLSALPLISSWVSMTLGSYIADFLLSKKILRLIRVRKLFTFLAITFLILANSLSHLCYSGFMINPLDIAPRYASFIMGLQTVFMSISALISPIVTGYFIKQDAATGWKNVFFLSSAINLLGMVFYLIFGQADIQDWAKDHRLTRF